MHVEHVRMAAAHHRHVLVEKPMALTVAECRAMIQATRAAGVQMIVGHSHSFDLPYLRTRALIDSGAFGRVRMINALNFTDFLYRPRRPEELDTARGGGAVYNQAPHQVDVVRRLAGGAASSIRASTGIWDATRPTEGAYSAHLSFENGVFASLSYNGYGRFDTDALCGWSGELGQRRDPDA
jgi:phthalate 4,5-cis-dihydrodiol dehydrogenase